MNKKRVIRLLGSVTTAVGAGIALVLLSGMSPGLEGSSLATRLALPAPKSDTRVLVAQADVAPVERPVSFSADQSDRGKKDFKDNCGECHGDDLNGGLLGGAPLKGLSFESKYANGAPAGMLFEVMVATMPPNAPGRYSETTYADMMAYILDKNGFQEGAPLPSDVDALYSLIMDK